jgi:hypothetical protein
VERKAMRLHRIHPLIWLLAAPVVICAMSAYIRPDRWEPFSQRDLIGHQVYAYRQWQSTGLNLEAGDQFQIRAYGEWSYSPYVGLHGPEGGLWAPDWYILTGNRDRALGGALLGRVGEAGTPFYVGRRTAGRAIEPGLLYLRINDDLLGDNEGVLSVEIEVTPAPTPVP